MAELVSHAKGLERIVGFVSNELDTSRKKVEDLQQEVDKRRHLLERLMNDRNANKSARLHAQEELEHVQEELEQLRALNMQLHEKEVQMIADMAEKDGKINQLMQQRLSLESGMLNEMLNQQHVSLDTRIVSVDALEAIFKDEARAFAARCGDKEDDITSYNIDEDEEFIEMNRRLCRMQVV